ncbi:MAG: hypothetical protein ACXAB7_13120 [Candidatus Kariarchaeaceae archaeon]|jgi:hypothetical protein
MAIDEFDRNKLLDSTLKEIGKIIKEDGYLLSDELELLKQVRWDVGVYEKALIDALEDSIITEEESEQLNYLKEQILSNVYKVANWDGILSEDEKKIIKKLTEIVTEYFV